MTGGNADAEDSGATFQGDVTATTIALNDGAGDAALIFNGTSAQTVMGNVTVTGNGDGTETLTVNNAAGVTFAGNIGAVDMLTIGSTAADSMVTFRGAVAAQAVAIGTHSSQQTITLNFTTDSAALAVSQAITASNSNDMVIFNVSGGSTTTFEGALSGVDTIGVGSSTEAGTAVFSRAVSATTRFVVTGGDGSDEHSSATFTAGGSIGTVALNDGVGNAAVTFASTSAQTVAGGYGDG